MRSLGFVCLVLSCALPAAAQGGGGPQAMLAMQKITAAESQKDDAESSYAASDDHFAARLNYHNQLKNNWVIRGRPAGGQQYVTAGEFCITQYDADRAGYGTDYRNGTGALDDAWDAFQAYCFAAAIDHAVQAIQNLGEAYSHAQGAGRHSDNLGTNCEDFQDWLDQLP